MKKLILILLIVAIAVMFTACDKPQEQPTFEQRVIESACNELNVRPGVELCHHGY